MHIHAREKESEGERERYRGRLREAFATPFYYIMRPSRSLGNGQHLQRILPPVPCFGTYHAPAHCPIQLSPTTRASLQIQLAPLLVGFPVPALATKCVMRVHLQRQRRRLWRVGHYKLCPGATSQRTTINVHWPTPTPPRTPHPSSWQTTTQWRASHGAQWRWAGSGLGSGSASGSQVECGNVANVPQKKSKTKTRPL